MSDSEMSPASKTSDVHRLVMCRFCNGEGKYAPEYERAIVLIQTLGDAGTLDSVIDDALYILGVKKSKREHQRRVIKKFCDVAMRFNGT